ncbi:MAG: efflux RND transporter periplasmic adaptor subunit [Burkholderiales bacterium]|jgi:membrane fusion protein (multidrug efflux system)|nr:efflux RND transporter periplasmic adaptor subunit [Burkholderiales bacterium]
MNTNNTVRTILIPALLIAIGGCGKKEDAKAPANAAPPPPMVSVITVSPEQVTNISELPGRVEAVRTAEVRARVGGIVQKRYFNEGSEVRAGQPLYQLDPAPYMATFASARATVGQAEANVTRAEANLAQATTKLNRYRNLVESNAVSKQEFDDLSSAQKLATADVSAARAAVDTARATQETAKLNLSWATVSAPISGRIGRTLITEGALVTANDPNPLAIIQQLDPIYVTLSQSSVEMARLREVMGQSGKNGVKAKLTLVTEDGRPYPQGGQLLFSEAVVDPQSSSVILRAQFPNPQRTLLPGMYVRVRVEQGVRPGTITVPQQAVMRTVDGSLVMTVDAEGKVAPRPVKTEGAYGTHWIISSGLKAGDTVIVEGLQKVKPGAPVKALPWTAAGPSSAAAPPNASGAPAASAATAPSAPASPAAAPAAAPNAAPTKK